TTAVWKLWLCGLILRSKTTKARLTNCPAAKQRVDAPCYTNQFLTWFHTTKREFNLCGFVEATAIQFLQKLQRANSLSEDEAINQLRAILARQSKLRRLAAKP